MNLTIAFTQSYIHFTHCTVHSVQCDFSCTQPRKKINTIRLTVYSSVFFKGVSKVDSHVLTVEGDVVSNLYKKHSLNLCNHTNFRIFTCTFSKKLPVKVEGIIHKE